MIVVRGGTPSDHIDAVILDKDGTLIDLDAAWGERAVGWLRALGRDLPGASPLIGGLAQRIGLDMAAARVVPGGVLAAGTRRCRQLHRRSAGLRSGGGPRWLSH